MFIVKYSGPFGFIKPWTAVRDSETYSQFFLTPSIIEGIEKKLFPELLENPNNFGIIFKIKRYRLNYQGLDMQQEVTWSKGLKTKKNPFLKSKSILTRGVLLNPELYLAFNTKDDADIAYSQTICLARNEDLLFPVDFLEKDEAEFDKINGFELIFTKEGDGFKVGYNRFENSKEMYGRLKVYGNPIRQ